MDVMLQVDVIKHKGAIWKQSATALVNGATVSEAELLATLVPEDQIHRVDHFLGKSTVLNILGLRFANRLFEPTLNAEHVAAVDIVFDESLALEGRAGYYDTAGALVDMVQSHLLQVLALLAMDAPPTIDARELRDRKAQVLRATRLWDDDVRASTRRARYTAGEIDGRRLPAYADEAGVDESRGTETLAEVVLAVDTWRWAGVPFRLRSGKAMSATRKEAVITFKQPSRVPDGLTGYERPDRLRIGFGPDRLAGGCRRDVVGKDGRATLTNRAQDDRRRRRRGVHPSGQNRPAPARSGAGGEAPAS